MRGGVAYLLFFQSLPLNRQRHYCFQTLLNLKEQIMTHILTLLEVTEMEKKCAEAVITFNNFFYLLTGLLDECNFHKVNADIIK